jgi:cytochrome c oxidase subunit II
VGRTTSTLTIALAGLAAGACGGEPPSTLDPRGPAAARIANLWWVMLLISLVVFAIVVGFLVAAVVRTRRAEEEPPRRVPWGEPFVVLSGVVVPALVLTAVFLLSLRDMAALSEPASSTTMTIDVTGHDWWWEIEYREPPAVTANEIHIPVGEPVELRLTTDDVLHSFWVPQLQAKTDMITGTVNQMWIEADEPGRYRGQCAEFCGLQHAQMAFFVVAQPRPQFDAWLDNQAEEAAPPSEAGAAAGEAVFLNETCAGCHAIRGTAAVARLGPDLTHLSSRETIAAGALDNDRDDLALWITDPQEVKPGASMPPTELSAQEREDLLDYLEQLD